MKRLLSLLLASVLLLALAGCGTPINYDLPEDPTEFDTAVFQNPDVDPSSPDNYLSIEYGGRTYIPYGTQEGNISGNDIGPCLGYLVQHGEKDENDRIFLLTADPAANYLVRMYYGGMMDPLIFYRAVDTRGQTIDTPKYIQSLLYFFWELPED